MGGRQLQPGPEHLKKKASSNPAQPRARKKLQSDVYDTKNIYVCKNKKTQSRPDFVPVFPGTNCEYDSAKAFERAGAKTILQIVLAPARSNAFALSY